MIHPIGEPKPGMVIRYLADHPEVLGSLAAGFKAQWSAHFADQSVDAIKMGFANCCRDNGLPISLVAMVGPAFGGTASLRPESGTVSPTLGPWLTHLYVDPPLRNQGIGTALIHAVEGEAIRHGFAELYAATARAAELFERLGWNLVEVVEHQGDRVNVLRKPLKHGYGLGKNSAGSGPPMD